MGARLLRSHPSAHAGDAFLREGKQFTCLADAVLVGVLPHAQVGKIRIQC
ncbi:MAG: hypothetical protein ABL911_12710 [Gallionella sp.]